MCLLEPAEGFAIEFVCSKTEYFPEQIAALLNFFAFFQLVSTIRAEDERNFDDFVHF